MEMLILSGRLGNEMANNISDFLLLDFIRPMLVGFQHITHSPHGLNDA